MVWCGEEKVLLNEVNVNPKPLTDVEEKQSSSNVWYRDNGASNLMTREKSKFKDLDEKVIGNVCFGDRSTMDIKEKGSVHFKCKN